MENRKKLGVDLDDTIWEFRKKFFEFYNNTYGTNHLFDGFDYSIEEFLGITKDESVKLFDDFHSSKYFPEIVLIDGFKEVFYDLVEFYEFIFITARPIHQAEGVIKKVESLIGIKSPVVHFTHDENWKRVKDKAAYCIEHGIQFMIEDSYDNAILCAEKGIKCFLLNYPWNTNKIEIPNIVRVNNWKEIKENLIGGKDV